MSSLIPTRNIFCEGVYNTYVVTKEVLQKRVFSYDTDLVTDVEESVQVVSVFKDAQEISLQDAVVGLLEEAAINQKRLNIALALLTTCGKCPVMSGAVKCRFHKCLKRPSDITSCWEKIINDGGIKNEDIV